MIGQPMPSDILKYEAKFAFELSARQCVIYGLGVISGLVGFFMLSPKFNLPMNGQIIMGASMCIPFFILGTVKPFGQNPEKIMIPFIIDNILSPAIRKKETHDDVYEEYKRVKKMSKKEKKKHLKAEKKSEYKSIV